MTALPPPRTEPPARTEPPVEPASSDPAGPARAAAPAAAEPGPGTGEATAPAAGPAAAASRRSLALMLLLTVLGAAVVLLAAGQTWARGSVDFQGAPLRISATGSETSGLPGALALVGLASAVAVFAVRGAARRVLGLLLALAGAATAAAALLAATGTGALDGRASRAVGLTGAVATGISHTPWPWVAALGGIMLLLAGLLVVGRGRDWPGMSSRYDAPGASGAAGKGRAGRATPGPETPADLWKALDRGEDPTR